jgi:hypothetical protein
MDVNDGAAAIELLPERREMRIAEPKLVVARLNPDAVGLQRVESVFGFREAGVDIGQRQRREQAEAAGMILAEPLHVIVPRPRPVARLRRIGAFPARRRGDEAGRDAVAVLLFDRACRAPGGRTARDARQLRAGHYDVIMDVETSRSRRHAPAPSTLSF